MTKIPISLDIDPIVEVIAEIRFDTPMDGGASTILGGGLFSEYREQFPEFKRLPAADMPYVVRESNGLIYSPSLRLGDGKNFIFVGDNSLAYSVSEEYPGWSAFSEKLKGIWQYANSLQCIGTVTRVALKYVNLLPIDGLASHLAASTISIFVSDEQVSHDFASLGMNFKTDKIQSLVQVQANAMVQNAGSEPKTGLVVGIDSAINEAQKDFWSNMDATLEAIHLEEKNRFFRLLTDETLRKLGPRYS